MIQKCFQSERIPDVANCPECPDCEDQCVCKILGSTNKNAFCCDCASIPARQCFPATARVTLENGEPSHCLTLGLEIKLQVRENTQVFYVM